MSYAVPAPVAVAPRRPITVVLAAALLATMAVIGLGYAVVTLVVVPGIVERFRVGAGGTGGQDVDGVVLLLWIGAGFATALAVVLFILYSVLAVGLRRGSNVARITTWVICGLGLLAGCGSVVTRFAQQGSSDAIAGLGAPLLDAYPSGWLGTNVALAVAQMIGYVIVAGLLVAAPGHFFGRGGAPAQGAAPGPYGAYGALPGMPGLYDAPPAPGPGSYGPPATSPYPAPSYPGGPQGNPGAPSYPPAGPLPPAPGTPLTPSGFGPGTPPTPPGFGSGTPPTPPGFGPGGQPPTTGGSPSADNGGDDQYWSRPPS